MTTTATPTSKVPVPFSVIELEEIMPKQTFDERVGILLVADYRTGSTFTGQLLNKNKDIFYLFEPLRVVQEMFSGQEVSETVRNRVNMELLWHLYTCNFPYYFVRHIKMWSFSRSQSDVIATLCPIGSGCRGLQIPDVTQACERRRHIALKTIRLHRLDVLEPLVVKDEINLKVLHLIRDPRGVASSMKFLTSKAATLNNKRTIYETGMFPRLRQYCINAAQMVKYAKDLPSWLEDRYKIVRYEDLAIDPFGQAESIYNFLKIPIPTEVSTWIRENTQSEHLPRNNMDTRRNSTEAAQSWRSKLLFLDILQVQTTCGELMDLMGYKIIKSEEEMRNITFHTF
ncbi:carbohydrate sulfotransferase 1-like [Glandiceps talaboti]